MSRTANPFRPGTVALVLLVGAGAFLLLLYALGQGWTGGSGDQNGGAHGASNAITGFAGLVDVLEATGNEVELSRNAAAFEEYGLLVLTPPHNADAQELAQVLEDRRYIGPTMLILPKWMAGPVPAVPGVEAQEGWVMLGGASSPGWFADLDWQSEPRLATGATRGWRGLGLGGELPKPGNAQALIGSSGAMFEALAIDSEGDMLAGRYYADDEAWPVVVVFEPDLLNNYGFADEMRARYAIELMTLARNGVETTPITFDLTFAGLGASENLLTLAFAPPFLAATLCLLMVALVIAWRGFARFGPPLAEMAEMAQGKRQLALNGAALIGRLRRWHLLADPYIALVSSRLADRLGVREHEADAREVAIDRALARAGHEGPGFAMRANELRAAARPAEILRAARALYDIERMLKR